MEAARRGAWQEEPTGHRVQQRGARRTCVLCLCVFRCAGSSIVGSREGGSDALNVHNWDASVNLRRCTSPPLLQSCATMQRPQYPHVAAYRQHGNIGHALSRRPTSNHLLADRRPLTMSAGVGRASLRTKGCADGKLCRPRTAIMSALTGTAPSPCQCPRHQST